MDAERCENASLTAVIAHRVGLIALAHRVRGGAGGVPRVPLGLGLTVGGLVDEAHYAGAPCAAVAAVAATAAAAAAASQAA